jgi:lipoprotein-releasing system permease protein
VIDSKLAEDLNAAVGERIRLTSSTGVNEAFTVAGIYDEGQGRGSAYITLRRAQSMYGLGTAVNVIFVKLHDIYRAEETAERVRALLPYKAQSWIEQFPDFLSSLRMQTASAYLSSVFSFAASSFATASVLIVSVIQKQKQIGILKGMGARRRQIQRVFLLEGFGIAVIGSFLGALVGVTICLLLRLIKQPPLHAGLPPQSLFPMAIIPLQILAAMFAAIISTIVAAFLPARRAARLNPVEVMR